MAFPALEIHAFACGNGDTILLKWPGPKWAIVDCRLPRGPIRDAVYAYFEREKVEHLEFICLTHPDLDHLLGMADLVSHFTQGGRSISRFCCPAMDPKTVQAVFAWAHGEAVLREYRRLVEVLRDLFRSGIVERYPLAANVEPLHQGDGAVVVPLSPDPSTDYELFIRGMERFARTSRGNAVKIVSRDANPFSTVLALRIPTNPPISALLSGDLSGELWPVALGAWQTKSQKLKMPQGFRIVKLPHHGSINSHDRRLASDFGGCKPRFALVSVGHSRKEHPNRQVLQDYHDCGWKTLLTEKRILQRARRQRVVDLLSKNSCRYQFSGACDVSVTVHQDGRISPHPEGALLHETEIHLYE